MVARMQIFKLVLCKIQHSSTSSDEIHNKTFFIQVNTHHLLNEGCFYVDVFLRYLFPRSWFNLYENFGDNNVLGSVRRRLGKAHCKVVIVLIGRDYGCLVFNVENYAETEMEIFLRRHVWIKDFSFRFRNIWNCIHTNIPVLYMLINKTSRKYH